MSSSPNALQAAMADCGLIAILRGLQPAEAQTVGQALYDAGFRLIEVPLNSPEPLASIRILRDGLPADCLVGAGTVIDPAACAVIRAAKAEGLYCTPGVATPTEAYAALAAGADALKMFPAEQLGVPALKAWRAVLRPPVGLVPVGGIAPESIAAYAAAGATGFGLGSALYQPGRSAADVGARAQAFVAAWRASYPRTTTTTQETTA